jgi:hypothetical protein
MRPRKTWEAVLSGRRAIAFEDFARLLLAFGFVHMRTRGSHHIFLHPKAVRPLSIQPRGGAAKAYQVAQFLAMVEEFGLTMGPDE